MTSPPAKTNVNKQLLPMDVFMGWHLGIHYPFPNALFWEGIFKSPSLAWPLLTFHPLGILLALCPLALASKSLLSSFSVASLILLSSL